MSKREGKRQTNVDVDLDRSARNRRYLTGEDAPHPGAMERLRDVEERTARIVRSIDALFKWLMRNAGWFQRIYYALERLNPRQEAPED